jgi:hypothetical protein
LRAAIKCLHIPQGPSLRFGLSCPDPSSLNRPHPPHSQAHRDFTAWRLIRDAFAVRERLGDPRVVPSFRCAFFPGMPSPETPGSPIIDSSRSTMSAWPSPRINRLGTPNTPAIRFARGGDFRGYLVRTIATACQVACPPVRIRPTFKSAHGGFYFQAFSRSVSLPAAGYDYNSVWTPLLAGLSPARTAASFAARRVGSRRGPGFE